MNIQKLIVTLVLIALGTYGLFSVGELKANQEEIAILKGAFTKANNSFLGSERYADALIADRDMWREAFDARVVRVAELEEESWDAFRRNTTKYLAMKEIIEILLEHPDYAVLEEWHYTHFHDEGQTWPLIREHIYIQTQ